MVHSTSPSTPDSTPERAADQEAAGLPPGFDFTDPDLYDDGVPRDLFRRMRATAPVYWNDQSPDDGGFRDNGYWVVTRHEDVMAVSRQDDVFSSERNGALVRYDHQLSDEELGLQRHILLNMDAPRHTTLRKLVARGFTPRAIGRLRSALAARAQDIVSRAGELGTADFVNAVARELPLQAIAELIGVPQEDRAKIFDWSNQMIGSEDPDYEGDPLAASTELIGYAYQLADERRRCPAEDIVTTLISADVDGDELSSEDFGFFVLLLAVAGNETTRNAISHGMIAFLENPDQWELFKKERPKTAADEIVRWATPVMSFQRTALADVELGGQLIRKGERVLMFYASANFDEEVFDDPMTFDITRSPNPHLGFGGTGAHYCVGANLARLEIDLIFDALAEQVPSIEKVADPVGLRSGWLNGIKRFDVSFDGKCPVAGATGH